MCICMKTTIRENKNGTCKYSETELKITLYYLKNLTDTDTDCKIPSHGQKEKEFSH